MNRSQLVDAVAKQHNLPRKAADVAIGAIFDTVFDAVCAGSRVEIRGFGSFTTREYGSYTGRNPRTGDAVAVPPKRLPFFKVGKDLRERVDS